MNADGTLDTSFAPYGGTSRGVSVIEIQNDDKVVLGGYPRIGGGYPFESVNEVPWPGLPRLNLRDVEPPAELASPRIVGVMKEDDQLLVSFTTRAKWLYRVESSDSLLNWTPVAARHGDGFRQTAKIPAPSSNPTQFFRISAIPEHDVAK